MKHRRVKRRFLDWNDRRAGRDERVEIQRHLDECADCRRYFDTMAVLMEGAGPATLPHLEPDPFLPAHIRANAAAGRGGQHGEGRPAFGRLAASVMGVAAVAAAAAGAVIGAGLSTRAAAREETQAIVNAYYQAFSHDPIAQDWEVVLAADEEDES